MMINTADVSKYAVSENIKQALYAMHLTFVFTVSILSINLLIALMANKVAHISRYR